MDQTTEENFNLLRRYLKENDVNGLVTLLRESRSEDVAEYINLIYERNEFYVFSNIGSLEKEARVLRELNHNSRKVIIDKLDSEKLSTLIEKIPIDDATDIINDLEEAKRNKVLNLINRQYSVKIKKTLQYGEETAGGVMIPKVLSLTNDLTVEDALNRIRGSESRDILFHIYIEDNEGKLSGVIALRKLVFSDPKTKLEQIANTDVIKVTVDTDREAIVEIAKKYNLFAVPVVSNDGKLVGSVTVDDMLQIMTEENSEDMLKLVGTDDEELTSESVIKSVRIRFPWLFASWIGGLVAALVIGGFEESLKKVTILAGFIPIILGMGGNIGTQACTIVVRSLATGAIHTDQIWKVLVKELSIAFSLGTLYGVLLGVCVHIYAVFKFAGNQHQFLGLTVGLSICISMFVAASIGALVPMLLKKADIDPAIATGPFVTTSTDIIGVLSYFLLCVWLLGV